MLFGFFKGTTTASALFFFFRGEHAQPVYYNLVPWTGRTDEGVMHTNDEEVLVNRFDQVQSHFSVKHREGQRRSTARSQFDRNSTHNDPFFFVVTINFVHFSFFVDRHNITTSHK